MGLLDIFGGGSGPEKAQKLKAKVTQKYGDPTTRQKAIEQLGEMNIPEAVSVLMARFTVSVDPATTDTDEKEHVFDLICGRGKDAVAPVTDFLRRSDAASSWALRILTSVLPENEAIGVAADMLTKLGTEYTRDPEKKEVLLHFVEEKQDERIAPAVLPFLDDMSDEVKIAALKVLGPRKYEPVREPLLNLLSQEEVSRRVKTAALQALFVSEFGVQGFREKIEKSVQEPFFLDKSGQLKKRS